jgi:hypothetical protein
MCVPVIILGCLQTEPHPRPGPPDHGIETYFDARPPLVTPATGSGYGSGYSGTAPSKDKADQGIGRDVEASEASEDMGAMDDAQAPD